MCLQEKTKIKAVIRNGRLERVPIKAMVKDCCEGYMADEANPSQCVSICHDGFAFVDGVCIPSCENCENGECLAPDECKCNDGYAETSKGCEPICDECINAVCIKPGVCECKEGFVSTPHGCVPSPCQGCENGYCLKSGECQCSVGYRWSMRDHKCKPKCKHRCRNGFCSAPNQCSCYEGYRKLANNEYICLPKKWDE
ncbi:epidermal growth factor-like protein, partial [Musca vetustissima]|uniref:epidermal growth factor-like protein n=1 Tax=Musca vetustissima TaxID=27455 RepID=UPI002AB6F43D